MKFWKFAIPLAVISLLLVPFLFAEENLLGEQRSKEKFIKTPILMSKGIAISENDVAISKIAIISVKLNDINIGREISIGLLTFQNQSGEARFLLKDIQLGENSLTSSLYSDNGKTGDLSLNRVFTTEREILQGELTIEGNIYRVFYLMAKREATSIEKAQKVKSHCFENLEECQSISSHLGNCGENPEICRLKIENYCENHPRDERCKKIFRQYCLEHLNDLRCREELRKHCLSNSNSQDCAKFCERLPLLCKQNLRSLSQVLNQRG